MVEINKETYFKMLDDTDSLDNWIQFIKDYIDDKINLLM
jgi:hypothetical protein